MEEKNTFEYSYSAKQQEEVDAIKKKYLPKEEKRGTRMVLIYFVVGIVALIVNTAMEFAQLGETFWVGFVKGGTIGAAIVAMIMGILYATGTLNKDFTFKRRLLGKE